GTTNDLVTDPSITGRAAWLGAAPAGAAVAAIVSMATVAAPVIVILARMRPPTFAFRRAAPQAPAQSPRLWCRRQPCPTSSDASRRRAGWSRLDLVKTGGLQIR